MPKTLTRSTISLYNTQISCQIHVCFLECCVHLSNIRIRRYTLSAQELRRPIVIALQQRSSDSPPLEVAAGPSVEKSEVLEEIGEGLPAATKTNESNRKLLRMGLIMRQIKVRVILTHFRDLFNGIEKLLFFSFHY